MKRLIWAVGGICAAAAGLLVWGTKGNPKVEDLAQRLEEAWSEHHMIV